MYTHIVQFELFELTLLSKLDKLLWFPVEQGALNSLGLRKAERSPPKAAGARPMKFAWVGVATNKTQSFQEVGLRCMHQL